MLLSLTNDQDIDFLKWEAALRTRDQKFPHAAAQKLKEILLDDKIQADEFSIEFNKIIASTESFSWKTLVYLGNIKNRFLTQITGISWFQISLILLLFVILYFINKKFKLKKSAKFIYKVSGNLLERFMALLGYFMPIVVVYATYIRFLVKSFPYLNLILPPFMINVSVIYQNHPTLWNFGYFFGMSFLCIIYKLPKSRFVRFHIVRGLMILAFQGVPELLLSLLRFSESLSYMQQVNSAMLLLVLNTYWILPCLVQAITHTYPRSSFIRDAVEIQLGRDKTEGFKWWDRQ